MQCYNMSKYNYRLSMKQMSTNVTVVVDGMDAVTELCMKRLSRPASPIGQQTQRRLNNALWRAQLDEKNECQLCRVTFA